MKKTIKTKVMAAVLAAVTMASAGAMIPTSVCAADFSTTEIVSTASEFKDAAESLLNRISDKDLEKLKNVGISTLLAGFAEFVPGGKTLNPALQAVLGSAFGSKQMTLEDIDKNIEGLYGRIDQFEKDMQDELKNILSIENFDYSVFTPYNSEIEGIVNAIKTAKNSKTYTTKQKLAIIAAQIDSDIEWKKGNSPFVGFTSVSKKLNNANLVDGNDMFTTIYNYFKQRSMFSGEAKAKAQEAVDYIYAEMLYGYALVMECLSSQLQIVQLEDKSEFDAYELNTICRDANDIITRMTAVTGMTFGDPQLVEETSTTIWFTDIEPEARPGRTIEKILYSDHNLIPPGMPEGGPYGYYGIDGYGGMGTQGMDVRRGG